MMFQWCRNILLRGVRIAAIAAIVLGLGAPARALDPVAPFQADLERLSEILGALHYLRAICGSNEGQKWRNEMQAAGFSRPIERAHRLPILRSDVTSTKARRFLAKSPRAMRISVRAGFRAHKFCTAHLPD
jgi:hypothetical protein